MTTSRPRQRSARSANAGAGSQKTTKIESNAARIRIVDASSIFIFMISLIGLEVVAFT